VASLFPGQVTRFRPDRPSQEWGREPLLAFLVTIRHRAIAFEIGVVKYVILSDRRERRIPFESTIQPHTTRFFPSASPFDCAQDRLRAGLLRSSEWQHKESVNPNAIALPFAIPCSRFTPHAGIGGLDTMPKMWYTRMWKHISHSGMEPRKDDNAKKDTPDS
jgi:hypothetical protein